MPPINTLHSEAPSGLKKIMRGKIVVLPPADQDASGEQSSIGHTLEITG